MYVKMLVVPALASASLMKDTQLWSSFLCGQRRIYFLHVTMLAVVCDYLQLLKSDVILDKGSAFTIMKTLRIQ